MIKSFHIPKSLVRNFLEIDPLCIYPDLLQDFLKYLFLEIHYGKYAKINSSEA